MRKLMFICVYGMASILLFNCGGNNRNTEGESDKGSSYGDATTDDDKTLKKAERDAEKSSEEAVDDVRDANKDNFKGTDLRKPADFIVDAAIGGMFEVEASRIALQKASSAKVKEFARQMLTEHSKSNSELKSLASRKNISVPMTLNEDKQEMVNKLNKLTGEDFDKAYMNYMVKSHNDMVDKFEDCAEDSKDAELKQWTSKMVPHLKSHHEMAKQTEDAIKETYKNN